MRFFKYSLIPFFICIIFIHAHAQTAADSVVANKLGDSAEGRMRAGDYHAAITLYTMQMKTHLRLGSFWYNRANAESFLSDYEHGVKDFDTALSLDSTLVQAYMSRAYMYMQLHRTKEALEDYEKGLKVNRHDSVFQANMYISRGNAYMTLSRLAEAESDFSMALKYNRRAWQAWLQRGAVRRKTGKLKPALEDLNKAAALRPKNVDILLLRGIVRFETQAYKPAIADLTAVLKIKKNNDAYFYRGQSRLKLGQDSLAREDFNHILAIDKKNIGALNSRAQANFKMKHPQLAIKDYSAIIELNPNNGDAYANRAYVYSQINDRKRACPDWQRAADLGVKQAKDGLKKYCGK